MEADVVLGDVETALDKDLPLERAAIVIDEVVAIGHRGEKCVEVSRAFVGRHCEARDGRSALSQVKLIWRRVFVFIAAGRACSRISSQQCAIGNEQF